MVTDTCCGNTVNVDVLLAYREQRTGRTIKYKCSYV